MRIGKTRVFQSMKYVLPALALLVIGALAISKNSSAQTTCSDHSNYYICYTSVEGGHVASAWADDEIYGGWPGNGVRALADPGYKFVEWKNSSGQTVSTNSSFTPCNYDGCSGLFVQEDETYTAYFEVDADAPVHTCTGYFICYAAEEGGQILDRDNENQKSGESGASSSYAGRGARAVANSGYEFIGWSKNGGKTFVSTNTLFIPCGAIQNNCEASSVDVQQYETITAYFRQTTPAPTPATETITLGATVDTGALSGKAINLALSSIESGAPMPSGTQGTISQDTTSVSFGEITYSEEGTWRYRISLQAPSGVAVDADNLEVRVRATLDETNNAIVTEKTYYKNDSELTSESDFFVNVSKIAPTPAEDSITLGVSVDEGALEGGEAISLSLNGTPAPSITSGSINKDTTSVSFGEMRFTEPGSHRYNISINNPYATAQPDAVNLAVKIDATLDESNNTIVTQKTYYKNDSEVSESDFVLNISVVAPTPVTDNVSLDDLIESGTDLSDFSASMTAIGDAPAPAKSQGEIIDDASVIFGDITFTEPGSYEYNLEFKNGDKTLTIRFVTDATVNRSNNTIQLSGRAYDEDGNQINYDQLCELVAELLTKEQPDDHGDDSGDDSSDDSGDSSDAPSSDTPDTPNTSDAILRVAPLAILSFAGVAVWIAVARKISR